MNEKLPYYMAYPMPFSFDDERIERMDLEYLKSMYPKIPKRILPYVKKNATVWNTKTVWCTTHILINCS